ncbi:testis-expressed protein 47 isoform X4 [Oncorhynchus keta]|uniref:testis-expressed protein 47 isoform X4 n=1 Tax=Oncorhynchus keta TaxID=8018 RepID=UPI0015F98254|nr:testis-expressed protein 47 isoform X4 [Oncorhynchus keta]
METSSQLLSFDQKKEEDVGTSLFHCHMKQRMLFNPQEEMKFLLHRLIVVASLPQQLADRKDLGVHYEELNQRLQRYYQGDAITGLLLLYPTCMLHVIESSSEVLVSLLQDLRDMQERPHCVLIEAPRVLVMSHDLPSRLFQQWSYKVLNVPARVGGMLSRDGPEREEEEDTDTLVSTALSMLLKLGNHLLKATKGSKMPLGSVLDEVPEMIVPQDILVQLLSRGDLLSPQQYLQAYHTPLHILMDSERTWPPPEQLRCEF